VSALEVVQDDKATRPMKSHCECGAGITLVGMPVDDEFDRRLVKA
jgi:hypothetical protein